MPETSNPYAPPRSQVDDVTQSNADAEVIRREHIQHETSIRSVGLLYYISGGVFVIASLVLIAAISKEDSTRFVGPVYLALGALSIFVAHGLRKLQPWARIASLVFSGIGLLGFPLGTLINGYILYLLLAKKGQRVFQADYPAIVAATPHVKYRTSTVTWLVLAGVILVIAGVIGMLLLRG